MIENIQAVSTIAIHHAIRMREIFGGTALLDDVVNAMQQNTGTGTDLEYPCPKCKGIGDYLPEVDGITLPDFTPLGNVPITDSPYVDTAPRITCSICSGQGYTNVQVLADPGI